jgi:hypothetical protein
VELMSQEAATANAAAMAAHAPGGEAWAKLNTEFQTAALADPEIGGSPEKLAASAVLAKRGFAKLFGDTPEAAAFFEQSALGSHPMILRGLARVGKEAGEATIVDGAPPNAKTDSAEYLLYPSMREQKT